MWGSNKWINHDKSNLIQYVLPPFPLRYRGEGIIEKPVGFLLGDAHRSGHATSSCGHWNGPLQHTALLDAGAGQSRCSMEPKRSKKEILT